MKPTVMHVFALYPEAGGAFSDVATHVVVESYGKDVSKFVRIT